MNKKMKKTIQRVLAFIVSVALVLGGLPINAKADGLHANGKITDPSTLHKWEDWFMEDSTESAGGVWTDKSVFESAAEFESALGNTAMDINMTGENNFLVALSALASNKEIVGYSTIPTDTILILDVSQSMDNSRSVPQMVASANDAIEELLELNLNNRVGIVLYSGNSESGSSRTSTGTLLLELGRYTPNLSGDYISYSGQSDNTTVSLASGIRREGSNQNMSTQGKSKTTVGATYIQNGIDIAMDEFLEADTVIESGNIQGGTSRMPIFVLMSDGAPTTGTASYTNIGTSTVGYGGTTSAGLGFMTQLTAAYAREQVKKHYETEPKFYTLGLNLSNQDNDDQYIAASVLDPENSIAAIDTYWETLFSRNSVSFYSPGQSTDRWGSYEDIWVTVTRNTNDGMSLASQNYVDEYFPASGTTGLGNAFADIVNEIILQSAYYPTLISGSNTELDGYVTIEDELGQFMEVKNVTGLMLGDTQLFTGGALTKMMSSSEFGNSQTYTELGWELVESVAERIGVSDDVAIELLEAAWRDGQLSYTNDKNFSNYIGWYEDANNGYVGYWNDKHTTEDIPANAKYITRSYGFYGAVSVGTADALESDMMHIVVKIRTEITTQHQDVVFMIPAALIPIITYHVELDSDSYDTADRITLTTEGEKPIRLLFEVGLRSDITEWNINEKLAEENLVEGQHIHRNSDGTYTFYTNQWGSGDESGVIDYSKPQEHLVTEAHFHPNIANERYYYANDTLIYVNTGTEQNPVYEEYTGRTAPTGSGYYHASRVFKKTNSLTNAAVMEYVYIPIAAETLINNVKSEDGSWYVEAGTIFKELHGELERSLKSTNHTNTLDYFTHHAVATPGNGSDEYDVWAYLGNNGKLTVTPATGIKLTKLVDETIDDSDAVFQFEVTFSDGNYDGTYRFVKADGTYGTIRVTNNKAETIELKAGETVYIIDLPANANFAITEIQENQKYKVDTVTVNGQRALGIDMNGTTRDQEIEDVVFTNTARQHGDLVISKTVTHDFGNEYVIPADKKFDVEVTLGLAEGTVVATSVGNKTVSNGKITFQLAHDESVTLFDLEENILYDVDEVNIPEGFTLVTASADTTGHIQGQGQEVDLVNDYNPTSFAPTAEIDINVTKNLVDVNGNPVSWNGKQYRFQLEKLEGTTWVDVPNATGIANGSNNKFTVKIPANYLKQVGTYVFRVHEDASNVSEGIVSETAVYFAVVVTDKDMDGALEVDTIRVYGEDTATKEEVNLEFTNTYVVTGSLVVPVPIKKNLVNETGVEMLPSGFEFGLYEGNTQVGRASSNANGEATIYMSYTSEWFNGQSKDINGDVVKTYTLKEIAGTKKGMTYSAATYTVRVVIGLDNNTLKLENLTISNASGTVDTATFENKYELTPTSLKIDGTKKLTGRNIKNAEFEFVVYETGSDFDVSKGTEVARTKNSGDAFTLNVTNIATAGIHYYVIEEVNGNVPGVTYDTTRFHVTAMVRDNNNGGLAIATNDIRIIKVGTGVVNAVEFNNVYKPNPTGITLTAEKRLEGKSIELNMFEFVLREGTTEIARVKNSATGRIVFPRITYTEAGTHVYTITEVNAGQKGYTYDDSSFAVTVNVTDDGLANLTAAVTSVVETDGADAENINDTSVIFRNEYTADPVTIRLQAVKLLENRHLANNEFTFQLFEADSEFKYGTTPLEITHNNARGEIEVTHKYTQAGTYYLVLKEDVSNPKNDIVYDKSEYQITVVVFDIGGSLGSRISYAKEGRDVTSLVFSNVFVPQDPVQKDVYAKDAPTISIDGTAVQAGDILTYEIDYTNFTNQTQNDLVITDTIPNGTTYVEGSASAEGFVSYKDGVLTWEFDDVKAGDVVKVTFDVKVKEGKASIKNQAHVVIGNNVYDTNAVTNYTFDKEVDKSEVKIGEEVTYTISYKNTEKETATITITDQLAEGLTYVDGSATNGGVYNEETHTITWTIQNVASLADGEVSFKATVNEKAVKVIDNVASIQVGNNPKIKVDTDTVETKILKPELEFTKKQALNDGETTTSVLQVKKGDKITYYLTITNKGNLAAEGIILTDKIPAGLKIDESSISNQGVLKDGVITWEIGELKESESVTVSFKVEVEEYNTEMKFTNIAQTTFENDPTEPEDPQDSNEVTMEYIPEGAPQTGDANAAGMWTSIAISSLLICAVLLMNEKKRGE